MCSFSSKTLKNFKVVFLLLFAQYFFQHHVDPAIGVYIIDRFTYYALEFLERVTPDSKKTLAQFVSFLSGKINHLIFMHLNILLNNFNEENSYNMMSNQFYLIIPLNFLLVFFSILKALAEFDTIFCFSDQPLVDRNFPCF